MSLSNWRIRLFPAVLLSLSLLAGIACSRDEALPSTFEFTAEEESVSVLQAPAAPSPVAPTLTAEELDPEPSAALAFGHVQKLAGEIGPRVYGTAEEYAAADYIAGLLQRYGYKVERQRFTRQDWVSRSVSLMVDSPERLNVPVEALTFSQPGTASGGMVFAGLGQEGDYPASARGRIVLVDRGTIPFVEKARNAAAAGATALVIANSEVDVLPARWARPVPPFRCSASRGRTASG